MEALYFLGGLVAGFLLACWLMPGGLVKSIKAIANRGGGGPVEPL